MTSYSHKFEVFDTISLEVARKYGIGAPVHHHLADLEQDKVIIDFAENGLEVQVPRVFSNEERWHFFNVRTWQPACSFLSKFKARYDVRGEHVLWLDDVPRGSGLSFTGAPEFVNIPMADPLYIYSEGYREDREFATQNEIKWRQRKDVIFWRGSSTGYNRGRHWSDLPRFQMCALTSRSIHAHTLDVGVTDIVQIGDERVVEEIRKSGFMKPRVPTGAHIQYKYAIDIDGNANSWPGLFVKMAMGNTILKVASPHGYIQWYYDQIKPWTHYVPVASNMSDLDEKIDWCFTHPQEAEAMARNAREFANALTFEASFEDLYKKLS